MRRTLVLTMHALAARGHRAILPDLPGQNDSMLANRDATVELWRLALNDWSLQAASTAPVVIASWRGGALIDDAATTAIGWWRMVPVAGATIVKTLLRTRIAGDKEAGHATTAGSLRERARYAPVELAGYHVSGAMLDRLDRSTPGVVAPLRTVMVGPAADQVAGSALWLRAEPGEDRQMATGMASDIAAWSVSCGGG